VKNLRHRTSSTNQYLAFLSAKYEVDPDDLFKALNQADGNKKTSCGELSIERRSETKDRIVFLISNRSNFVAQFAVTKEFLSEKTYSIKDLIGTGKMHAFLARKTRKVAIQSIKDLRSGMTQICLKAKVLEIPKPNQVITHYGNYANVTNALIGDGTGTIHLCLWNEMINCVSTGDTIRIKNARTAMFKGQIQLKVGKKGLSSSTSAALTSEIQPVSSP
jgi:hypothetical protein